MTARPSEEHRSRIRAFKRWEAMRGPEAEREQWEEEQRAEAMLEIQT